MVVAVARRPRPCVRCGEPRHGDLYLCAECACSFVVRQEITQAMQADPEHPRLFLIQHGWRGGWSRVA